MGAPSAYRRVTGAAELQHLQDRSSGHTKTTGTAVMPGTAIR